MWMALVDNEPRDAVASSRVKGEGWLAAWSERDRAPEDAWRVDPRVVDPRGPKTTFALCAAPDDVSLSFDDPAVTGAVRSALSSEPGTVCTTLMNDDGDYVGVLIAPPHLGTPFATIFPQRVLEVEAGVLGRPPWPTGPGTQRYGGDVPWPFDRWL
jgi:hypothetical protein